MSQNGFVLVDSNGGSTPFDFVEQNACTCICFLLAENLNSEARAAKFENGKQTQIIWTIDCRRLILVEVKHYISIFELIHLVKPINRQSQSLAFSISQLIFSAEFSEENSCSQKLPSFFLSFSFR